MFRRRSQRDFEEEIASHILLEIDRLVEEGMSPAEARLVARKRFGNITAAQERYHDSSPTLTLEAFGQDVRFALRTFRRAPAFTAAAVISVAIGIGATTAIFSAYESLVLKTLPVPHPEQLVSTRGGSYPMYKRFRALTNVFSSVATVAVIDRNNMTIDGASAPDPSLVRVALVSGSYFSTLAVNAAVGRTLSEDDDRLPSAHPFAVISDNYWRRVFSGASNVLGETVSLNGTTYTVVGVMPRGFRGESQGHPADVWIPAMMQSEVMPEFPGLVTKNNGWLRIIARLRPGITVKQATAAIQPAYRGNQVEFAGTTPIPQILADVARDPIILEATPHGYAANHATVSKSLGVLLGAAAAVLIIACANVANLLLARGAARRREIATRLAIGASRRRIIRQLITESVLLALGGGATGFLVASWGNALLSRTMSLGPTQLDSRNESSWVSLDLHPDSRVFFFAAGLCVLTGLLFGFTPALRASRLSLSAAMTQRGAGAADADSRFRLAKLVIVGQVALSLALLAGAGLFLRTLLSLRSRDLGIDREHLLFVWTSPGRAGYQANQIPQLVHTVVERLSAIPGVAGAGMTNHGLLEGRDEGGPSEMLVVDGQRARAGLGTMRDAVTPGFFRTAGMKLIAGRDLSEQDAEGAPRVAVINETLARFVFGTSSAVGHRFGSPSDQMEIIGVVRDAKHGSPRDARGVWYIPYRQYPQLMRNSSIVVRASGSAASVAPTVRRELASIDPKLPLMNVNTVQEQLDDVLFLERLMTNLSTTFALLAVSLACVGLYGVMSYVAAKRTNEIGIRLAFGAKSADVLGMVLRESLTLVAAGLVIGLPAALACFKLIRERLFDVGGADATIVGGAIAVLVIVSAVASWIPAWRAANLDPVAALRCD